MDKPNSYFFPIGEAPFLLRGFCMPVPMARSSAKRLAFFVTNMYDCAHGDVICKATSIFRHKFVWLCPWRGHVENEQYFWPPICMTVPMARSSAKRPAFFVTNLYDCTHGEVICNATSIFRVAHLAPIMGIIFPPFWYHFFFPFLVPSFFIPLLFCVGET